MGSDAAGHGGDDRGDTPDRQRDLESPSRARMAHTYRIVTAWTGAAATLALTSVAIYSTQVGDSWSVFAIGTVVAAAGAFVGAVFGFIFGVPRVLASDRQARDSTLYGGNAPIIANTNL